jgi:CRP-like cAMP-binding protein
LNIQPLIDHFEQLIPFKTGEKQLLTERVTQRSIRRRQAILQEGFPCKHYTFIVEGCFRMFAVDPKGTEHTIQFAAENDWIADIGRSALFIEAIEPPSFCKSNSKIFTFYMPTSSS